MKNPSKESDLASSFVERLVSLADNGDRGRLANLRRALSPTTEHYAWPVLCALAGAMPCEENRRLTYQTVGGLFALHPVHKEIGGLGATCRLLRKEKDYNKDDPFDRRFRRLLASDSVEDLRDQLIRVVKMAKSSDKTVAVDYIRLFKDLSGFAYNRQRIKVEWARGYWSAPAPDEIEGRPTAEEEVAS
jgi:CRISPR type I-E-associated protein CasB/Cse2